MSQLPGLLWGVNETMYAKHLAQSRSSTNHLVWHGYQAPGRNLLFLSYPLFTGDTVQLQQHCLVNREAQTLSLSLGQWL